MYGYISVYNGCKAPHGYAIRMYVDSHGPGLFLSVSRLAFHVLPHITPTSKQRRRIRYDKASIINGFTVAKYYFQSP